MSVSEVVGKLGAGLRAIGAAVVSWWSKLEPNTRENVKYIAAGMALGIPVGVWLA